MPETGTISIIIQSGEYFSETQITDLGTAFQESRKKGVPLLDWARSIRSRAA